MLAQLSQEPVSPVPVELEHGPPGQMVPIEAGWIVNGKALSLIELHQEVAHPRGTGPRRADDGDANEVFYATVRHSRSRAEQRFRPKEIQSHG